MRNEFWSTCGALQSFGLFFFFDAIIGDAIIDVIIGTKVEQKLFFEQFESGSDFVLKRNARKPRKYVTPHIQHAPKRSVCKSIIKIKNKMWILVIDIARLKTKKYNEQFAEVSRICLKIFHIVHVWDIFVLLRAALLWLELEKGPMQNWLCRACCPLLEIFHV